MNIITDGSGAGYSAAVNSENRLEVHSVSEPEIGHAVEGGLGYNINTGNITLSAASGVLYFKNNESKPFVLQAIAIGLGSATVSDSPEITIYRNPTTGTLISGASAVAYNQNRNFGSSETLASSIAYKGASGNTIADGNVIALFYQTAPSRGYYSIDMQLEKGSSVAVYIDPKLSSGSVKCYAAIIGYLKPFNEV